MIKLSHSGINTYFTCPKAYDFSYNQKLKSMYRGSALFYGSAVDNALNYMLENLNDSDVLNKTIEEFNKHWEQQDDKLFGLIDLPKYEYILYSKYDFDSELLEKSDWRELFANSPNPIESRMRIEALLYPKKDSGIKALEFHELSSDDKMFYNYTCWLSLRRKTPYLIKAYYEQLVPQIKRVIEVQKKIEIEDSSGNILNGYVDFICELQDGTVVVADNKTSSIEYEEDSVETSSQLAKYKFILNTEKYGYNIEKAAYFVMSKKLTKEKTCKKCGHVASSSHKTCNAEVDGVRCHGEWDKKYTVDTQLIVQEIPAHFEELVMENTDEIMECIEKKVFPRNLSNCINRYGKACDYYNICHKKDTSHIIKIEDKK